MGVGDNIKRIRQARDITQSELGKRVGKSQKTISTWELGTREPNFDDLQLTAKVLGVSPAELVGHSIYDNEFEYIVTTDDMSPEIIQGDTLTVDASKQPHDGDIVVIENDKKQQLIRRVYELGNRMLSLLALNPSIKPVNIDKSRITIKGTVTELRRKI